MKEGFIKLERSLTNWRYFKKPNYLLLWIYMLLEANHNDKKWQDIVIKRGQFVTSLEKLSNETGISKQTIRTIISKLNGEELTYRSTNKYTLITILKYNEYQSITDKTNTQNNNQLTNNQQSTNKQLTTNNNDKNEKNEKKYIYSGSEELVEALKDFEEMRKKIKKPLTERAKKQLVNRLDELSKNEEEQIKILEQSIMNCWQSVYPVKQIEQIPTYDNSNNRTVSAEEEEELMKIMGKA